jgi:hypothetical protein
VTDAVAPRTVAVRWERVGGWISRYGERHPGTTWTVDSASARAASPDGSTASFEVPFPPLRDRSVEGLGEHLGRPWQIGVVIVRKGGFAVARAVGPELAESKVGRRHVQGRTKAGGWSQQRFARRRENQAREAYDAASGHVHAILLPHADALDMLALAGDRAGVEAALDHRALAPLRDLPQRWLPGVPDPNRAVLADALAGVRSVEIAVYDATR